MLDCIKEGQGSKYGNNIQLNYSVALHSHENLYTYVIRVPGVCCVLERILGFCGRESVQVPPLPQSLINNSPNLRVLRLAPRLFH